MLLFRSLRGGVCGYAFDNPTVGRSAMRLHTASTNPNLALTEVLANGLLRLKSSSCFISMVLAFCQNWNLSGRFGPVGKETYGYGLSGKLILGVTVQRDGLQGFLRRRTIRNGQILLRS